MKKFLLLFTCLFADTALYAYDGNAPLFPGDESWKWLNMNLVLFAGGCILFLYIVRRLYDYRLSMSDKNVARAPVSSAYVPRYWFQCKNCRLTIRKETPPKNTECSKAVSHLWTQLAEVGTNKYLCRNCTTLIEAKSMPVPENCTEAEFHNWELLK